MGGVTRSVAATLLAVLLPLAGAAGQGLFPDEDLVGTIWASQEPFGWTSVDHTGEISHQTSDGNYVEILDYNDGVYVFMVNWWNLEAGLNVVEYGILVPSRDDSYVMLEAEDRQGVGHTGITGHGFFRIEDRNTARIIQVGRLADGGAGAFSNLLDRVEAPPNVPLPLSRPSQ